MKPTSEYLVLSRGQWDKNASKEDIEVAIAKFYDWLQRNIEAGRMKMGSRLSRERAVVSKRGIVTDAPIGEAKEVVGGYWFIVAASLDEAASLAAQNPCAHGTATRTWAPGVAPLSKASPANWCAAEWTGYGL